MKIEFWVLGKTSFKYLDDGIKDYSKRLERLTDFQMITLPDLKANNEKSFLLKEAKQVLERIKPEEQLILLDERGQTYTSLHFAKEIEKRQMLLQKKIIFLVGGAYGFDESIYKRANAMLSLSPMTFSHQIIRLLFLEQLYRGMTIIKGLPYHHE
ncbi:MAG: 23S rRNA (pseudouridine(1915)-N(3))-methyltransferase RlmH [Chitinophagales bacterium]|nr:23S rRNA (pseudouridine(1915)-N(3))-methyltransferase RlmH [Chitinophagales bacterium]MCZ2393524.1 23S rRNA (pseudouridine(1915)-N(3))-methyltransferase RlmH [Chitinophagales bacterium]